MEQPLRYPVDIIAAFNPIGQIKPLYLRIENEEHELITLAVRKIITCKTEQYGGIPCIHYFCDIEKNHNTRFFCDIYYYIETHKWMLYAPPFS